MRKQLRDYQQAVKSQIYAKWDEGKENVLLVVPTGGGKTVTFSSIAIDHAVNSHQITPVAIVVHRKELVQQISLTLAGEDVVHNIIAQNKTVYGIIAGHRREFGRSFYDSNGHITVISVDTLNARWKRYQEWAKKVGVWITDEAAHLLRDNKWGRAVQIFPNAKGLGVTATPERLDKKGLGRHADGVFDCIVEGPTTNSLIEMGHLCKYKVARPPSDFNKLLKDAKGNADFTKMAMAEASSKSQIVGDVVENYFKFAEGKQTILFATDIETATKMEKKFTESNVKVKLLTGETNDNDRLQAMIDFREKKIQVLLNVDLFDEGLDVPGIECVQMARPTMSLGKYLQMVGRGLRPAPGKEYLILIDHVGNVERHGMPHKVRYWTLDRLAKRRKPRNLVRICENPECYSPYDRELTECPWCGTPAFTKESVGGGRIPPEMVDGDLELMDPFSVRQMEAETYLEDPGDLYGRVAKAAGIPAAKKAVKDQEERFRTQLELREAIASWAGRYRDHGLSDREIHKKFFLENGMTINQVLSKPTADMKKYIGNL